MLAGKRDSMPRASLARVSAVAGANRTASGASEGSSTRATSRNAAGPTKRRALCPRSPPPCYLSLLSPGHIGDRQGTEKLRLEKDQGVKVYVVVSGCALVARCARVDIHLLGDAGAGGRADEVICIGRLSLRPCPPGLPEGDVQLVLAQLLDGDGQRMLGPGVDLRARDAEGIVEAQGRGVLVDLARPLGAGHGEAVTESTLSRSSSILRSCSIFASSSMLHLLDHFLAGRLAVLVYDLVVELVAGRDLSAVASRLSSASSVSVALPVSLRRVSSKKARNHHSIGTFYWTCLAPWSSNSRITTFPPPETPRPCAPASRRVTVFGPLEAAILDPTLELLPREEDGLYHLLRRDELLVVDTE